MKRITRHVVFDTSVVRHHLERTCTGPMLDEIVPSTNLPAFHIATTTLYELQAQLLRRVFAFAEWTRRRAFWSGLIDRTEPILPYPGPRSPLAQIDPALYFQTLWAHLLDSDSLDVFAAPYEVHDDTGSPVGQMVFTADEAAQKLDDDRRTFNEKIDHFVASCKNDEDTSQGALIRGALAHARKQFGDRGARKLDAHWRVMMRVASMRMSKTSRYSLEKHPNDFIDLTYLSYLQDADVSLCMEDRAMRSHMEQAKILDIDRVFNISELVETLRGSAVSRP